MILSIFILVPPAWRISAASAAIYTLNPLFLKTSTIALSDWENNSKL